MTKPFPSLDTRDPAKLKGVLKQWILDKPSRGFYVAEMSDCKFGIVDPDRANFLGLSFKASVIEGGGASGQHLGTEASLKLISKYGEASKLNGQYCWMFSEGSGSSIQRFVCLKDLLYEKD